MPRSTLSVDEFKTNCMLLGFDWYDAGDHTYNFYVSADSFTYMMVDADTLEPTPWVSETQAARREAVRRGELGAADFDPIKHGPPTIID